MSHLRYFNMWLHLTYESLCFSADWYKDDPEVAALNAKKAEKAAKRNKN